MKLASASVLKSPPLAPKTPAPNNKSPNKQSSKQQHQHQQQQQPAAVQLQSPAPAPAPSIVTGASTPGLGVTPPSPLGSSTPSHTGSTDSKYKWFSAQSIKEKITKRKHSMPEYEQLLMAAAVKTDAGGTIFDTSHPSWLQLIKRANEIDRKNKSAVAARTAAAATAGSGGGGSGSDSGGGSGNGTASNSVSSSVASLQSPAIASSTVIEGSGDTKEPPTEWISIDSVANKQSATANTNSTVTAVATSAADSAVAGANGFMYTLHPNKPFKQQPISMHSRSDSTNSPVSMERRASGGANKHSQPRATIQPEPTAEERKELLSTIDRELAADAPDRVALISALQRVGITPD